MSPLSPAFQEPAQAPAGAAAAVPQAAGGFWSGLVDLVREPGVVEVLLAAILVAAVAVFWWRISRLVRGSKSRHALHDYLFGIEQALHGDLQGAHEPLQKVLAEDPENHFARPMRGNCLAKLGEPEHAFQFNDGYNDLIGTLKGKSDPNVLAPSKTSYPTGLVALIDYLSDPLKRYSYSFDGAAQALDHILINKAGRERLLKFGYARVDADFPLVWSNDATRPERISDHDAPVVFLSLDEPAPKPVASPSPTPGK